MLSNKRSKRPVTFSEALGADANGDLTLNTFEQATCAHCGAEPRLHTHVTPKGRTVAMWIPPVHNCAHIKEPS